MKIVIQKSVHKYYKREGVKGSYKYYYTKEEYDKEHEHKQNEEPRIENLVNKLRDRFAEEIKDYGITEIFEEGNELFTTSDYDLPESLIDDIKKEIKNKNSGTIKIGTANIKIKDIPFHIESTNKLLKQTKKKLSNALVNEANTNPFDSSKAKRDTNYAKVWQLNNVVSNLESNLELLNNAQKKYTSIQKSIKTHKERHEELENSSQLNDENFQRRIDAMNLEHHTKTNLQKPLTEQDFRIIKTFMESFKKNNSLKLAIKESGISRELFNRVQNELK